MKSLSISFSISLSPFLVSFISLFALTGCSSSVESSSIRSSEHRTHGAGVPSEAQSETPSATGTRPYRISFEEPPSIVGLASGEVVPPTPDELNRGLEEAGEDWLYGPGFGRTVGNIGAIVLFPPYALYLLGNAVLTMSGYEPVYITDALPEEPKSGVLAVYDGVTSVPGRVSATIAGEEYREGSTKEAEGAESSDNDAAQVSMSTHSISY